MNSVPLAEKIASAEGFRDDSSRLLAAHSRFFTSMQVSPRRDVVDDGGPSTSVHTAALNGNRRDGHCSILPPPLPIPEKRASVSTAGDDFRLITSAGASRISIQ